MKSYPEAGARRGGHNGPVAENVQQWEGKPKTSDNVARSYFNAVHLLPKRKTLGSNTGAPNLFLAPGAIQPRYAPARKNIALYISGDQFQNTRLLGEDATKRMGTTRLLVGWWVENLCV